VLSAFKEKVDPPSPLQCKYVQIKALFGKELQSVNLRPTLQQMNGTLLVLFSTKVSIPISQQQQQQQQQQQCMGADQRWQAVDCKWPHAQIPC